MILDHLGNADVYSELHPLFRRAFQFLRREALNELPPGRHELAGDDLYVMVIDEPGKGGEAVRLEAHRRYLDIQLSVGTADLIGWKPLSRCRHPEGPFAAAADVGFYADEPEVWLTVPPGCFAVFFPQDAHAPMAATGLLHKVVVKVATEG